MEKSGLMGGSPAEYILSFSSFYKAAYARDILEQEGISSTLKKLPPQLVRSCSTGLYLRTDSIQQARQTLERNRVSVRGIYLIKRDGSGSRTFTKI